MKLFLIRKVLEYTPINKERRTVLGKMYSQIKYIWSPIYICKYMSEVRWSKSIYSRLFLYDLY